MEWIAVELENMLLYSKVNEWENLTKSLNSLNERLKNAQTIEEIRKRQSLPKFYAEAIKNISSQTNF